MSLQKEKRQLFTLNEHDGQPLANIPAFEFIDLDHPVTMAIPEPSTSSTLVAHLCEDEGYILPLFGHFLYYYKLTIFYPTVRAF